MCGLNVSASGRRQRLLVMQEGSMGFGSDAASCIGGRVLIEAIATGEEQIVHEAAAVA